MYFIFLLIHLKTDVPAFFFCRETHAPTIHSSLFSRNTRPRHPCHRFSGEIYFSRLSIPAFYSRITPYYSRKWGVQIGGAQISRKEKAWVAQCSTGLSWALLGAPGLSWTLLGPPGLSRALLGPPGPSWAHRQTHAHAIRFSVLSKNTCPRHLLQLFSRKLRPQAIHSILFSRNTRPSHPFQPLFRKIRPQANHSGVFSRNTRPQAQIQSLIFS